ITDIFARIASVTTSILLARAGWAYWALAAGTIALPLATAVGAWTLCRWVPGLPRRHPGTGPTVRFAVNTYGQFMTNYFTRNLDNLLVGWRFGSQPLGFYKKAYDLFALPVGHWDRAHLRYPRLASPLDWKGGPVVPLGRGGVRGDGPALSCCATLRACRNRLGLGRFRLGSHHSRTPVRGATATPSDHPSDRRRLEIRSCLRAGRLYICPDRPRNSVFGWGVGLEWCNRPDRFSLAFVCDSLSMCGHP